MRYSAKSLGVLGTAAVLTLVTAGCGSGKVPDAISSLASGKSISPPSRSATASPAPSPGAQTPTAQPSVAPAHTAHNAAASGGSGSSLLWLWILIGVVLLAVVIMLITRSAARRRAAAIGRWRSAVLDAYAKGAAVYDAMSVAERWDGPARDDDGARWADIQRRADDLAQALYALREAAPDENQRARVAEVLGSLQAVRSAMDAERVMYGDRVPRGDAARQADVVRGRLLGFEASLRALRAQRVPDQPAQ